MNWQILLAISIFATVGAILLQRILLKDNKSNPILYSIVFQLLAGFFIGIFAILNGFKTPNFQGVLPNFILMPVLWAFSNIFIFKSLKIIEASEFTIFYSSRAFWTILASVLFLQESFSLKQVLGALLIVASIILVSWKFKHLAIGKGQIYALIGAMMFGLGLANDSFIVANNDVPSYFSFAFILPAIAILMIYPTSVKNINFFLNINIILKVSLFSLFAAISAITYFLAYQLGHNAAQLASINQISTILTVILAMFILKERSDFLRKIFAASISVLGVILVG